MCWLLSFFKTVSMLHTYSTFSMNEVFKIWIIGQGGLISCYAGVTRPSRFGRVGCMSTSLWWASTDFQVNLLPSPAAVVNGSAEHAPTIYMDSGTCTA